MYLRPLLLAGSVHAAKEDPEQRETYETLLAMKRYHKRYGKVNVLLSTRFDAPEGPVVPRFYGSYKASCFIASSTFALFLVGGD